MPGILTDEEALLAALDEDSANYTVLAALADLKREQGEDNVADWLEWAIRMKRKPHVELSASGFLSNEENSGRSVCGNPHCVIVPVDLFSAWIKGHPSRISPGWRVYLWLAAHTVFDDPGWPIPEDVEG